MSGRRVGPEGRDVRGRFARVYSEGCKSGALWEVWSGGQGHRCGPEVAGSSYWPEEEALTAFEGYDVSARQLEGAVVLESRCDAVVPPQLVD